MWFRGAYLGKRALALQKPHHMWKQRGGEERPCVNLLFSFFPNQISYNSARFLPYAFLYPCIQDPNISPKSSSQNFPKKLSENAPNSLRPLTNTREYNSRTDRKSQRLSPLILPNIAPREQRSQSSRCNEETELLPSAGGFDQDAPSAKRTPGAYAYAGINLLAARDTCSEYARADSSSCEANTVVVECDKRSEKGR